MNDPTPAWFRRLRLACIGLLASLTAGLFAVEEESAALEASVLPGVLSIRPESVNGPFTPRTGSGVATSADQPDAVVFRLRGIVVEDFNGDGQGFRLTASPGALIRVGFTGSGNGLVRRNTLAVGTVTGFHNSSDPANTSLVDPNTLVYNSGAGVELEVDYELAYTIPRQVAQGEYTGVITFSLVAE